MDASYAITRVFADPEKRRIEAIIPAKAERPPKKGTIPVRRFKWDARNRLVRCLGGKVLRPHGQRIVTASSTIVPASRIAALAALGPFASART
jgi:hypothetical protein